jgi:hypothetical protein
VARNSPRFHVAGVGYDQAQVDVVRGLDEGVQEAGLGQVDSHRPVLDAVPAGQITADLVQNGQSAGGEDDVDAVGRQVGGERAADPGRRAGDHGPGAEPLLVDVGDSGTHDAPSGLSGAAGPLGECDQLGAECFAGFEDGFESAQDPHPPGAGDAFSGLRSLFELVVDDGEQAHTVLVRLDLPGHPAWRFGGEVGVVQTAVADDEAVWRVGGTSA